MFPKNRNSCQLTICNKSRFFCIYIYYNIVIRIYLQATLSYDMPHCRFHFSKYYINLRYVATFTCLRTRCSRFVCYKDNILYKYSP